MKNDADMIVIDANGFAALKRGLPPPNYPAMVFAPTRYYHAVCNLMFPPFNAMPKGGDSMGCLWRNENEPRRWHFTMRNRYYAEGPVTADRGAWDGEDMKKWTFVEMEGEEEVVAQKFRQYFEMLGKMTEIWIKKDALTRHTTVELNLVLIQGGWEKFDQLVRENKLSWLHRKTGEELRAEQKGN